ncbi:MAG: ABC transporter ATP-binding protein [Rhodospirillaceae bacterium]
MLTLTQLVPRGLAPFDLTLQDGACLTVSGPSGAGKTVLLRAIADLDVNAGEARAGSLIRSQISAPVWRKNVAYVPADTGWWADHVHSHMPEGDPGPLLDAMDLDRACLSWPVAQLSTGERQRLALVRALLAEPEVLLLDEPTSALDVDATKAVERLITDYMSRGATVVIVTHDDEQAQRLGDQHLRVDGGKVEILSREAG